MPGRQLPSPGDDVDGAVEAVLGRGGVVPSVALVLGSGLGEVGRVARELAGADDGVSIAYSELPGFPRSSVPGHAGTLWLGRIGGVPFVVFHGRVHFYEGHPMSLASITSRVASGLGATTIVLTTATGGLDPALGPGALVVVRDHVNLMGENPLRGWRYPDGTPLFLDVAEVYDRELAEAAIAAGGAIGLEPPVTAGVYAAVSGPSYETPVEAGFLRATGATVVGMSMVPEALVARALGLRVLGLSFVTNAAGTSVSHEDVVAAADRAAAGIARLLVALLERFT